MQEKVKEPGSEFKWVGTRPDRPDGVDKVTGRAKFGADLVMAGQLVGKVLRSPHPHARISVDRHQRRREASRRQGRRHRQGLQGPALRVHPGGRDDDQLPRRRAQRDGAREGALRGPPGRGRGGDQRGDRQGGAQAHQGRLRGAAARHRRGRGHEARRAAAARGHVHGRRRPRAEDARPTSPSASSSCWATWRPASSRPIWSSSASSPPSPCTRATSSRTPASRASPRTARPTCG